MIGDHIPEKQKTKPAQRDAVVTVRTSSDEKTEWSRCATGLDLSVSDWVRHRVNDPASPVSPLTGRPTPRSPSSIERDRTYSTVDPNLLRGLSAIGNNINQIARKLNREGANGDINLLHALVRIERLLDLILAAHKGGADDAY